MPKTLISPKEYLDEERKAEEKSEYLNGEVLPMPRCSEPHVLINSHLICLLAVQLRGFRNEVLGSDMRLRVDSPGSSLYCYPDISVTHEKPEFEDGERDILLNPLFLIEIMSKKTERHDRYVKAPLYRKLESLQELLLVSQYEPHAEKFTRRSSREWLFEEADGLDASIQLTSLGVTLKLSEIYRQVEFPPS